VPGKIAVETKARDKQIQNLQEQLRSREALAQQTQSRVDGLNKEIDKMTLTLSATQQENVFLSNKLEATQHELEAKELALSRDFARKERELQDQVRSLTGRLDKAESALNEKEAKTKTLHQESDDLAKDYFEVLDENVALKDQIKELRKKLNLPVDENEAGGAPEPDRAVNGR
jgi:chromosome segregation ATPase